MSSNFNIRFYKRRSFTESKHWLKILHKSSSPRSRLADADLYPIYQSWNLYRTNASLAILPVEMIWIMTVLYSAPKVAHTEHCKQVLWWLLWYTAHKTIQELGRCACCCVSHLFGQKVDLRMGKRLYQLSWMGKRYQLSRMASACNFSRAMYFCDLFLFTEQIKWQQDAEGGKKLGQLLHRFKQSHYICCCLSCLSLNTLLVDNAATCCTPPWSLSLPSAD